MLLDDTYPMEIAGLLHSGPAAFLSESICGLLNQNHVPDMPDPCLPVEVTEDGGWEVSCVPATCIHYPVTPALRDGGVELSVPVQGWSLRVGVSKRL